jgi:hypothetical protein
VRYFNSGEEKAASALTLAAWKKQPLRQKTKSNEDILADSSLNINTFLVRVGCCPGLKKIF